MRFSTIFTGLFFPYIAHEQTAQNLILSVRLSLFALFLIERHRSQNHALLKSEERFQRAMRPVLIKRNDVMRFSTSGFSSNSFFWSY